MASYVLIAVHYGTQTKRNEEISAKIGRAKDWAKFMPSTWLIWTGLSPAAWFDRISPLLAKNDTLFVAEVTYNWKGRVPPNVAEWVERGRTDDMDGE
ncbi:hypothetical protein [Phenylobacterium sp.]|uniref:hypothetical protein n=1 Tax=Phenylobacterium sp. TaxID=1871053 RepID=UPI0030F43777